MTIVLFKVVATKEKKYGNGVRNVASILYLDHKYKDQHLFLDVAHFANHTPILFKIPPSINLSPFSLESLL